MSRTAPTVESLCEGLRGVSDSSAAVQVILTYYRESAAPAPTQQGEEGSAEHLRHLGELLRKDAYHEPACVLIDGILAQ